MQINGLETYSFHGDECINSVKFALSNGVRLIDTASAYTPTVLFGYVDIERVLQQLCRMMQVESDRSEVRLFLLGETL